MERIVPFFMILFLCGCGTVEYVDESNRLPPPTFTSASPMNDSPYLEVAPASGEIVSTPSEAWRAMAALKPQAGLITAGCRLQDRFDRESLIAYEFMDGQARIGLNLKLDSGGIANPGKMEMKSAMIKFRYRFQEGKQGKEKCRYNSPVQGLVGSAFNELHERKDNTVWQALQDMNPAGLMDR